MDRFSVLLALICFLLPPGSGSAEELAMGQLLVASHELRGPNFEESVVLLLHYDANGAIGLIVNRPMDIAPTDAAPDFELFKEYSGPLYFGGPVAPFEIRALLYSDNAVEAAVRVFDRVYLAPFNETLLDRLPSDASQLRFFSGYAGWSPGQLEHELERGSWHVQPASVDTVFAEDTGAVWPKLVPPLIYQAATHTDLNELQ